jgi:four helix bundle protein
MGEKITKFTDLIAWQEGHKLVMFIYEITKKFPKTEMFGLTSQMQRAAVSITSNVTEGFARQYRAEKLQFYSIAKGSLSELQNQLIIAKDNEYVSKELFDKLFNQSITVEKLINGLVKKIRASF